VPEACPKCERGLRIPEGKSFKEVRALSDEEKLERGIFCDCEMGRLGRRCAAETVEEKRRWIAKTVAKNAARAQKKRDEMFHRTGVPARFAGYTLDGFLALAGDDPGKQAAVVAVRHMLDTGNALDLNGDSKRSIYLYGDRGVGKTGLLMPVFLDMFAQGRDCLFTSFLGLMRLVRAGYDTGEANQRIERAIEVDVLFLDDIGQTGRTKEETDHTRAVIQDIIYWRHGDDKTTLMTSNLTPLQLSEQFAPETYQRVEEMAAVIRVRGKVLRKIAQPTSRPLA